MDDYIDLPTSGAGQWYRAIEKSLTREVKEEVGLEIDKFNYLVDIAFIRPDGVPVIVLSFWADYNGGEVKLNDENIKYVWATLEETKNYDLIEGIWEEVEMVDKIKRGVFSFA